MWNMIHRYRSLVAVGIAKPLLCPDCDFLLTPYISEDDENIPAFWCVICGTRIKFGADTWSQIDAVVKEHFEDEE